MTAIKRLSSTQPSHPGDLIKLNDPSLFLRGRSRPFPDRRSIPPPTQRPDPRPLCGYSVAPSKRVHRRVSHTKCIDQRRQRSDEYWLLNDYGSRFMFGERCEETAPSRVHVRPNSIVCYWLGSWLKLLWSRIELRIKLKQVTRNQPSRVSRFTWHNITWHNMAWQNITWHNITWHRITYCSIALQNTANYSNNPACSSHDMTSHNYDIS